MTDPRHRDDDSPRPSRWSIFRSWWTQEKFLQDIVTRTVSALLTLAIAYIFALTAGYIAVPHNRNALLQVFPVSILGFYLSTIGVLIGLGRLPIERRGRISQVGMRRLSLIAGLLLLLLTLQNLVHTIVTGQALYM